jgi:hypothetical protein
VLRSTSPATNLSANTTPAIGAWCSRNKVELCLTPTSASWANPIEAQFGPLRSFTMANSNYPSHTVLAREMQQYLRWRNANARHPDVLAAQRRERARVRSERQHRWGQTTLESSLTTERIRRCIDDALSSGAVVTRNVAADPCLLVEGHSADHRARSTPSASGSTPASNG